MKIIILTPGAGGMYCGNCLRDNALVHSLRESGHDVTMVPLYLPLTLDEPDESAKVPIFYSGINVYLDQKLPWFGNSPTWVRNTLSRRGLLRLAAGKAGSTRPSELGEMTISMLKGGEGHQSRDMQDLLAWLKGQPSPDLICLSNALLLGMAAGLKAAFPVPLLCFLQGEDSFLDALSEPYKSEAWQLLTRISRTVDQFISPSHYFADLMIRRLDLDRAKVAVVPNGIRLDGYPPVAADPPALDASSAPVIGYFARQCRDKGLDILVEAFIRLNERGRVQGCRLKIGGSCAPTDKPFLDLLRHRLGERNLLGQVTFHPNIDRNAKIEFLHSLTLFSVPARYGEAFGLYLVEALASGVPIVQPRTAAFTEFVEASGAGCLFQPEDADSLASALETLLLDHPKRLVLRQNGLRAAHGCYSATIMANRIVEVFQSLISRRSS